MQSLPLSAVIGALIGGFIGLLNSGVLMSFIFAPFDRKAQALTGAERAAALARLLFWRRVTMVLIIVVFAAIGVWLGLSLLTLTN